MKHVCGRLKGRFRILRLELPFRECIVTCCILYNILRDFDGLNELKEGVHWEGVDGLHDAWVAGPQHDDSTVAKGERHAPGSPQRPRPTIMSSGLLCWNHLHVDLIMMFLCGS